MEQKDEEINAIKEELENNSKILVEIKDQKNIINQRHTVAQRIRQ